MSKNLDEVEVHFEYRSPDVLFQSTERLSSQKKGGCARFVEMTTNIFTDPIFIEIFVVAVVIGGSVLSSVLAIYAGKSYSGPWL